ncbi:hypothetical protein HDU85_007724 [Gaertneriomyces sp. JEL0708]|nr:hypothetical protein HDU85_007724 [Gaertneriomyces sp. JEL0708]
MDKWVLGTRRTSRTTPPGMTERLTSPDPITSHPPTPTTRRFRQTYISVEIPPSPKRFRRAATAGWKAGADNDNQTGANTTSKPTPQSKGLIITLDDDLDSPEPSRSAKRKRSIQVAEIDSDDDGPITSARMKPKRMQIFGDSEDELEAAEEFEQDSDDEVRPTKSRRLIVEDSDEDTPVMTTSGPNEKGAETLPNTSNAPDDDVEDDLQLDADAFRNRVRRPSKFKEAMKQFKARKEGHPHEQSDLEAYSDEGSQKSDLEFNFDSDGIIDVESDDELPEPSRAIHRRAPRTVRAHPFWGQNDGDDFSAADDNEEPDSDLEDFIVDQDPNDTQESIELPQEFKLASATLKDSFNVLILFFVKIALNRNFGKQVYEANDARYIHNIRSLDDRIEGFRFSLVSSEAWQPDFRGTIEKYPYYEWCIVDGGLYGDCEACRRTNHPATRKVFVSGRPYDRHTLKNKRREPAAEGIEYVLGRFCCARSKLYHDLYHYKIHLASEVNDEVQGILEGKGDASAEDCMEFLKEHRVVARLWDYFKELLERGENYASSGGRSEGT